MATGGLPAGSAQPFVGDPRGCGNLGNPGPRGINPESAEQQIPAEHGRIPPATGSPK